MGHEKFQEINLKEKFLNLHTCKIILEEFLTSVRIK